MKPNTEKDEKICWACKRKLVGVSKFGLCPDCLNKYGSPLATVVLLGITAGITALVRGLIDMVTNGFKERR